MKTRAIAALLASTAALSGCYVVPMGPDGLPRMYLPMEQAAIPNQPPVSSNNAGRPAAPASLSARLYPANDLAKEVGMVSGSVTNMMTGKGRFQLSYRGEVLTGEATRVSGDERKGMASAWGSNGAFMSCEYQMSSPVRGAGTCDFSDGARYTVHIGN